jgi:hypothetical protein
MTGIKRREKYQPLMERTLENYQVQHLSRKYDFGKESLVARLLVREINKNMDAAEASIAVARVKPFCLYIKKGKKEVVLPLFSSNYLEPMLNGKSFTAARLKITDELTKIYRKSFPSATKADLLRIINPCSQLHLRSQRNYINNLVKKPLSCDTTGNLNYGKFISGISPVSPLKRINILDASAPGKVICKLAKFVKEEAGLGNIIARQLVEDIITIRNVVCPRTKELKSGEMPMLVTHVSARLSEDTTTRFRQLSPVIITVLSKEEQAEFPSTAPEYLNLFKARIIRVCFEAYKQNGLLTLAEMQWIFMISSTRISEFIRSGQYEHNIIVPTPGTILDAGRSITHKDIIVKLHLQGHSVKEISRITYHSPRSVDSYIGTFEAVLILYLYKMPVRLMSRILGRGATLIQEHLNLIDEVYPDVLELKKDLIRKGVRF